MCGRTIQLIIGALRSQRSSLGTNDVWEAAPAYFVGSGGHSTIHGHDCIVFTLLLLFLTIVIFIAPSPSSPLRGQVV